MSERHRLFDWRFLLALALVMAVAGTAISGLYTQRDNRHKDAQITALVAQFKHSQRVDQHNAAIFAANQKRMLDYTTTLAERQRDLLQYLNKHGIKLPVRYLTVPNPPHLVPGVRPGSGGTNPPPSNSPGKSHGHGKGRPKNPNRPIVALIPDPLCGLVNKDLCP